MCLAFGCKLRPREAGGPVRMDVPVLCGMVVGTVVSCLASESVCQIMCRLLQAEMTVDSCQVALPGLVFAAISSTVTYVLAFQAE